MAPTPEQQQEQLESDRARDQIKAEKEEQEKQNQPEVKRMGWGIFILTFLLMLIQMGLGWLAIAVGVTIVALIVSFICWVAGAAISGIIWLILRPYRASMKEASLFLKLSLVFDAIPGANSIPVDVLALIYAFMKSRSKIAQKLSSRLSSANKILPVVNKVI